MRLREEIVKASRIHQLKISGNDLLHLHYEEDEEETWCTVPLDLVVVHY